METPQKAPVTIAHRAGNDLAHLRRAVAAGVDFVEADIRWDGGPVARHERRVPFLPVHWDRWYFRWDTRPSLSLSVLLDLLKGAVRPYLDVKAEDRRVPAAILEALRSRYALSTAEVSGYWPALEALRAGAPELRLFRSVGQRPELEALLRLLGNDPLRPAGVAIDGELLTPALAAELRERELDVYVWGVRELTAAKQLLEWGATGIIADNLELLRALKAS